MQELIHRIFARSPGHGDYALIKIKLEADRQFGNKPVRSLQFQNNTKQRIRLADIELALHRWHSTGCFYGHGFQQQELQ